MKVNTRTTTETILILNEEETEKLKILVEHPAALNYPETETENNVDIRTSLWKALNGIIIK